jgi:hypothetical protein
VSHLVLLALIALRSINVFSGMSVSFQFLACAMVDFKRVRYSLSCKTFSYPIQNFEVNYTKWEYHRCG